jgi:hypothetical protein
MARLTKPGLLRMLSVTEFSGATSGTFSQSQERDFGGAVGEGNIDTEQAVPSCDVAGALDSDVVI